ncbi:LysR family transcriptional regulator [Canicola haemoglobinophilus]|uniref:LysR family transcriptional regulator n=1 Tax=Canicola haemoglobinophilus TaxID=733 RepID=A0A1V4AYE9_9PAST|nr:LysR family transcriptional regulator [Canicola haemoglobinophilus]OOR96801.1 LysR family transcriptional regulator [Canicola haemoglobinophilus]STO55179.1 LysR family transcriptional regulator [Canicola haemoglobinophilus]STO59528.1 LysR family transcriptional regulator [Canicola haemoglobinophilus]STO69250.1 LysR family transcriptional regulator [Canicola haemoglobinophilus]
MNLSQLKTFMVLSECLNVTETAEKLFCTQPSVSIKIRKLEESLNTVLFERINNRLYLTEQGKIFRAYVKQMLSTLETSMEHLHQYDDPNYGKITIGASHFVGVYLLPKIIAEYKQLSPNVELSIQILPSQQLIQKLENHQIDFLIMSDQVYFDPQKYQTHRFLSDELILIASPNHPLAEKTECDFASLSQQQLIIKPSLSETRKFIFQHLNTDQIAQLKIMEFNSLEGIKHCVINELGVSIISRLAVTNELNSGLLVEIPLKNLKFERGINYIFHKDKYVSPAIQRFLSVVKVNNNQQI